MAKICYETYISWIFKILCVVSSCYMYLVLVMLLMKDSFVCSSSGGLSSLSPSSRESVDPIAELLSQLSGVRRSAAGQGSTPTQLQQLQMQLQLERQQVRVRTDHFIYTPLKLLAQSSSLVVLLPVAKKSWDCPKPVSET